jgi:ABC-type Fe3+-hydroxamate transport system substrate-binding protein
LIAFFVIGLAGCERSASSPTTAPTTAPTTTQANAVPNAQALRIVALSPAVAIILRDMGYGQQIVGRHGYDLVLDPRVPVCGDQAGINFEALLKVSPTHVFTQWGTRELPARLTELASTHRWMLEDTRLLSVDDIPDAAQRLDRALAGPGGSENGSRLVQRLQASFIARTPEQRVGIFTGPVLMLVSTKTPSALGPGSFHHQILERLGGSPAITSGNPYIEMSAEDIVRLAPQAILLFMPKSPAHFTNANPDAGEDAGEGANEDVPAMERLGVLRTLSIPAVKKGRVVVIDDPRCLTPSSAMMSVAGEMERALRAWNQ